MRCAWSLLLGLAACVDASDTTVVNRGRGCAYAWPPTWDVNTEVSNDPQFYPQAPNPTEYDVRAFAPNEPALIWVRTTASPCATGLRATCSLEQRGNELVFTSRASWNEAEHECVIREAPPSVTALCKSSPLDVGTYTVRFGEAQASFSVPEEGSLDPCFEAQ